MNLAELFGKDIKVIVDNDLSLTILWRGREIMWGTSKTHIPAMLIRKKSQEVCKMALGNAKTNVLELGSRKYHGFVIHLDNIDHTDTVMEMIFAIDPVTDELLVEADQIDGTDTVVDIEHLYCFEKPITDGGYMVLPHGSGYLIPADCPDELPGQVIKEDLSEPDGLFLCLVWCAGMILYVP